MTSLRDFLPAPRNAPSSPPPSPGARAARPVKIVDGGGSTTLALRAGADGAADFSAVVRAGDGARVVHADRGAVVERARDASLRAALVQPGAEETAAVAERTRAALDPVVEGRVAASRVTNFRGRAQKRTAEFVRYTPASTGDAGPPKQRIIKMVQAPVDPMEPPRFSQKKTPHAPRSPPVPVLHSPERALSKEEKKDWVIPPSISNWKNNRGYTVPLDKRLATDASGSRDMRINDKFASLAETMYLAEKTAREQVELRAQVQRSVALKAKEAEQQKLRALATHARQERAGLAYGSVHDAPEQSVTSRAAPDLESDAGEAPIVPGSTRVFEEPPPRMPLASARNGAPGEQDAESEISRRDTGGIETARRPRGGVGSRSDGRDDGRDARLGARDVRDARGADRSDWGRGLYDLEDEDEEVRRRDAIRAERRRERDRELRQREVHGEEDSTRPTLKRSKLSRDRDRDLSERVALGQHGGAAGAAKEVMYDERLFNQGGSARGMAAGFGNEDADVLYDKPLFEGGQRSKFQYRPSGNVGGDGEGGGVARFKPDKALGGKDATPDGEQAGPRTRPVEFEREEARERQAADPFGLNDMLGRMGGGKGKK